MSIFDVDDTVLTVVVNPAEQWSIWPADRDLPSGWRAAGMSGSKQECIAYIEDRWVDMRPLDLRHPITRNAVSR